MTIAPASAATRSAAGAAGDDVNVVRTPAQADGPAAPAVATDVTMYAEGS